MSNVKIIDIKSLIEKSTEGKHTSYQIHNTAVLEGPTGVIAIDNDACHQILENSQETIQINAVLNDGAIKMHPEGVTDASIEELLKDAPVTEQPLVEYIQWFGSRIEYNYRELLKSIESIGLNPDDFKKQ